MMTKRKERTVRSDGPLRFFSVIQFFRFSGRREVASFFA